MEILSDVTITRFTTDNKLVDASVSDVSSVTVDGTKYDSSKKLLMRPTP